MLRFLAPFFSFLALLLALFFAPATLSGQGQDGQALNFTDVSKSCGIDFQHTDGGTGQRYVVESMSAGLALFDFDGDGLEDIYFVNGATLDPNAERVDARNALYRNLGNLQFEEVGFRAGVDDSGYGLGVVAADYDGDGDQDLYVTNYGANVFFENQADGTFRRISEQTGTTDGDKFGAGAVFVDIDRDGDLDLYTANYQIFTLDQHKIRVIAGHQFHPGPGDYPPQTDSLFRNEGDGRFVDISESAGIRAVAGTGMGVIASDIDDDGDSDILVANDSTSNFLFINDGSGHFSEESLLSGFALDRLGNANGNMGIECGDVDGDGRIDLLTTTYQGEMPVLYFNQGGFFADVTNLSRIDTTLFAHVNWGAGIADFDNDRDLDLFVACGHFMDNIQYIDDTTTLKVRNYLMVNDGNGKFKTAQDVGGLGVVESSRGAAFGDLDNDGDLDVVVVNSNAGPTILRNDLNLERSGLHILLSDDSVNRSSVGARIELHGAGKPQVAEVCAGRGYQSHYGSRLHFGMGDGRPDEVNITVRWPDGAKELFSVTESASEILLRRGQPAPVVLRR